jgi:hypothetical protein
MNARTLRLALFAAAGAGLAGCTTSGGLPPTQVVRYHLDTPITRGTIAVQPLMPIATDTLSFAPYAAAVQAQLVQLGYTVAPAGTLPDFVALADLKQDQQVGPPRRSPISIGLGAGGYSGGWRGGTGVGGGVSFPVGGGGARRAVLISELSVTIKRRADQSAVWEGHARGIVDARSPAATAGTQAGKLATALFSGFPGESGRTIEVK